MQQRIAMTFSCAYMHFHLCRANRLCGTDHAATRGTQQQFEMENRNSFKYISAVLIFHFCFPLFLRFKI